MAPRKTGKATETKTAEAKTTEANATETKAPETNTPEVKKPETKTAETEAPEAGAAAPKVSETSTQVGADTEAKAQAEAEAKDQAEAPETKKFPVLCHVRLDGKTFAPGGEEEPELTRDQFNDLKRLKAVEGSFD